MSKKERFPNDNILNIAVALLVVFGYIMVISAHSVVALKFGNIKFLIEIFKITLFILLGLFSMIVVRRKFSLKFYLKYEKIITIVLTLAMLATLLFPGQGGGHSWIRIPGVASIQPVEFVKIHLIILFSQHFASLENKKVSAKQILRLPVLILLITTGFVFVVQKDLGSALILLMIFLGMFFALPQPKFRPYKLIVFSIMVVSIVIFYIVGPALAKYIYGLETNSAIRIRLLRIAILFDPFESLYTNAFQIVISIASFATGGLLGHGLGNSDIKYIVPEPYNDAIIAVIADELGLIGIGFIFVTYLVIITRIFAHAMRNKVILFDKLVLIGIATFFASQFFVNIGGMSGLIPMTGVTLLFVSSGGSSTLSAFISIGIVQAIVRKYA